MKFICSKYQLLEGINIVQKAVSSKTTLPILEGILIECTDKLKLTGNDLEIGIESFIEADILEQGSIVINSKMFGDIVRRLPESLISIEIKQNNTVFIDCQNSHFEIMGISPEGFPAIPTIEKNQQYKVSQKVIKEMLRQTIFAVGSDENKKTFTGSLIECKDNELVVVSIDGFRMALNKHKLEENTNNFSAIVPGKTLHEIIKILQNDDKNISIYANNSLILFDLENCKIISRLIDGEFINYQNILPIDFETKIRVRTKDFLSSMERASLINSEEKKYPVKFTIGENKIIINSNTNVGNAREELFVDVTGLNTEIGFNPRYFIEALKVLEDEIIDLYFTSSVGPCTIKPIEKEAYIHMILPIRIKNESSSTLSE